MKKTNRLSTKRLSFIIGICFEFIIGFIVLSYFSNLLLDQLFFLLASSICFFVIFVLQLISKRLKKELPEDNYITYSRIFIALGLCFISVILMEQYAPDYFAPIMIVPLFLYPVLDIGSIFISALYMLTQLAICSSFSSNEIICYLLMISIAGILGQYLLEDDLFKKILASILLLLTNFLISIIFYYFNHIEISKYVFLYALISSLIVVAVSAIFVPLLNKNIKTIQADIYEMFLEPDYSLVNDIRSLSFIEYQHASRVSRLSRLCASEIHANESLAACGGFYYRLGKLEGEPMINNAIKIANNHCFPEALITLISEYGGIISLPTSKESAIVHMVDTIVTKVELFDSDSMSSSWNQNMVIYQTINELSAKGFYDESGLTMNQFLIIREKLANEDILS